MQLMTAPAPGISAFPSADGDLTRWRATLNGVDDTPYAGLVFKLSFAFPADYPYKPPEVLFRTPIYHPNVDFSGRICLDILKSKWSAAYNIRTVLLSLQSLLGEPNKYVLQRWTRLWGVLFSLNWLANHCAQRLSPQRRGCRALGQGPRRVQAQGPRPSPRH